MIGVLQQYCRRRFYIAGSSGERRFGKAPRGSARELTDRKDRDYEDWDWE